MTISELKERYLALLEIKTELEAIPERTHREQFRLDLYNVMLEDYDKLLLLHGMKFNLQTKNFEHGT